MGVLIASAVLVTGCSETCPGGRVGPDCAACEVGYQDRDGDGTCLPSCETAAAQGFACERGACSDASGWPACACEPGVGGEGCGACDPGYQDNDANQSCVASCETAAALGFGCASGTCSDASGTPTCACAPGYTGALCDACVAPAIRDAQGACVTLPATCADVKAADAAATDGFHQLYVANDVLRPWLAFCRDMAGTPAEYLQLSGTNFSQYTAGGASAGTNVRTTFTRVRIDPVALAVDIGDLTYAASSGALVHSGGTAVTAMPFGVAMSCSTAVGAASIDLRGTPFVIAEQFCQGGGAASGTVTLLNADQTANLTGSGACGWTSPTDAGGCLFNPFNATGGFSLQLAYQP